MRLYKCGRDKPLVDGSKYPCNATFDNVTLDTNASQGHYAFTSNGNQSEIIVNSGNYIHRNPSTNLTSMFNVLSGGSIVVNGGTFTEERLLINMYKTHPGIVTINDGVFNLGDNTCLIYDADKSEDNKVVINGGTFNFGENAQFFMYEHLGDSYIGNLEIHGGTFNMDPSNYVAEGCMAVEQSDGTWKVVPNESV